jgi:hypothetical protein
MEQKMKEKRRFLHLGVIRKTDMNRWKITQNEDISIPYFIDEVARLASESAAKNIHWYDSKETRQIRISLAIEQKMKQVIDSIIAKDYPRK